MTDVSANDLQGVTDAEDHHGPTDRSFVRIAVVLAIITAIEVAWSYLPVWDGAEGAKMVAEIGGLLLMMMLKFVIVAGWFMHLKFDKPILARLFYAAFVLAVVVYVAVLAAFEVFSTATPGYTP